MKLRYQITLFIALGAVLFHACSTKKDAFINRNWHALNTQYNTLYNGGIAFEKGRETLNEAYRDNYWEILPVERMEVTEEIKLDSEDNNPNFLIAEEKATKAIQKHSMEIGGIERNPQTDEAFLLLGKARYFDQRYIPALEAFNYILRKYTDSDKLNEATIWREKTNIRLENEELALKNLKRLLQYESLKDQEYADARAMMAQAYINLNVPDTAVQQLKIAAAYTGKKPEKGRYYYIIGQLYEQLGYPDSANYAFNKVIELNRSSPRIYYVNAQLQQIANTETSPERREELLEWLSRMEDNRENRPFLGKIYHQLGEYHMAYQEDSLGISYYNKSLRDLNGSSQLNALNYERLAEFYFDKNQYPLAGAYYDSVLNNLPENTKKFRTFKKKRDNLEEVVNYETQVAYADSVIGIYEMSIDDRLTYFGDHIAQLKAAAEAREKVESQKQAAGFAQFGKSKGGKENQGKFYFYNITTLGYGRNEFRNKWGERELEDNWRWSNKNKVLGREDAGAIADADQAGPGEIIPEEQLYSLEFYMDRVPQDQSVIDSLQKERNFANYQLGLIYKEKFREYNLAAAKLEAVLDNTPEERLVLPSKYNLYKIYEQSSPALAEAMKKRIISEHPSSRYAELLLNPRAVLEGDKDSPEARYTALYELFEQQEYLKTITGAEENINQYTGEPIVAKFELLKANAIGRLQGFEQFREALNYVALNYPNLPEGKKAQEIVAEQLPKLEPREFTSEDIPAGQGNWKVVYPFRRNLHTKAMELKGRLENSVKELSYNNKVSVDIYDLEREFVVVHGFKSRDFALGYVELLKINRDYRIDFENFVILSDNYKTIQVHKNLADYQQFISTPKP
ncbi:tetratricopeptide repeat protein [Zeaxanthinibacter sp. PT1]|uniref:type IX secretion system periplasmic lipoprotein PorW/SprE n=1 Tax=Zeaxanthinibacter TaxID=561554 RepID=UPI002349647A|nr:tetratricopeptide repeat protein [Zeaxanthinibacter sp. PT1]MDC6350581.1 tetratricopeptide repeat protein [Zeaxanthinibacter sp. PT1]